jgi:pimeloyl-ACP methyl ester carboxylesterase
VRAEEEVPVETERVEFDSDGRTLRGVLVSPDRGAEQLPAVVMAGGWCYVKELVLPRYAEKLVEAGLRALLFDLRCLGESDGSPRQELDPWGQIDDYRAALDYLETRADVDASRLGAWGISYSGGHVLVLAAIDPRVRCVVSNVPVIDGYQNMRLAHGTLGFRRLVQLVAEDRRRRAAGGEPMYLPHASPDPAELSTWPFPETYEAFAELKRTEAPRYENRSTVRSVDLLLRYSVMPFMPRILDVPVLMLVAEGDDLVMWDLELAAFQQIPAVHKHLQVLRATTHMTLYSDRDRTEVAAVATADWFAEHLGARPAGLGSRPVVETARSGRGLDGSGRGR